MLNGIKIDDQSWHQPGWKMVDHFDREGTLYRFVFDPVIGSMDGNTTVLNDGDDRIQEFGIKLSLEKVTLRKNSNFQRLLKSATTITQPEESVWNPIRVSDRDSKLHGGKVGLGEPILRNPDQIQERVAFDPSPQTRTTITIKFVNEINLLQWAREWKCSVDEIHQPLEYEKEEEILVKKNDVKRVIEDVIDS